MASPFIIPEEKPAPKKPFPKKAVLTVLAFLAGVLLLAACGWFVYFQLQFTVYQDDHNHFSIKYPKGWKVIPHPLPNVAVEFVRPKDTALDLIYENFNVTIQPVPYDIVTLEQFSATIKRQMTTVFGRSVHISEDKAIYWGWREGREMTFDAYKPDHLKMVNAWVLKEDQAYILTFLGDMSKSQRDDPVIHEMISSFRLQ